MDFRYCSNLQTLNLASNGIGDDGAKALADGLKHCRSMQTLNLSHNKIFADGAKAIAGGLKHCPDLKTLNLEQNFIGTDGANALTDSLKHCPDLQILTYESNSIRVMFQDYYSPVEAQSIDSTDSGLDFSDSLVLSRSTQSDSVIQHRALKRLSIQQHSLSHNQLLHQPNYHPAATSVESGIDVSEYLDIITSHQTRFPSHQTSSSSHQTKHQTSSSSHQTSTTSPPRLEPSKLLLTQQPLDQDFSKQVLLEDAISGCAPSTSSTNVSQTHTN